MSVIYSRIQAFSSSAVRERQDNRLSLMYCLKKRQSPTDLEILLAKTRHQIDRSSDPRSLCAALPCFGAQNAL
jgi:hypothetical protein